MSRHLYVAFSLLIPLLAAIPASGAGKDGLPEAKSREFLFTYGATVTKLEPGQMVKIWVPIPPSNDHQKVEIVSKKLPGTVKQNREETYGNEMFYITATADKAGKVPLEITYKVKRLVAHGGDKKDEVGKELLQRFLQADAKVPINGKPLMLVEGKDLPKDEFKMAKVFFDIVNEHMTYSKKGTGWGEGDSNWACDSKYGNCTDFHSLFISLARGNKLPAKFEMGFAVPTEPIKGTIGGYHCWAWFKAKEHGWVPVDISQANQVKKDDPKLASYLFGNLTADRVAFTTGRDINLSPKQAGGPLNYFIYPYVEVGGEVYPAANVERRFSYEAVK